MTGPSLGRQAWPFLVGRGRNHGYRTLLAPDFLVAEGDYGVLDDSVAPGMVAEQVKVVPVVTRAGRRLTVVHTTHQVTAADIAEPGNASVDQAPRDEFGRPLQLMYGFVCAEDRVAAPHPDDLNACRETALPVYRRFLGDEEGFTVQSGRAFPMRSALTALPAPPRPVSAPSGRPPSGRPPSGRPPSPTGASLPRRTPALPGHRRGLISAGILVLIGILIFGLVKACTPEPTPECDHWGRCSSSSASAYAGRDAPAQGIESIGATRTVEPGRGAWIIWPLPM
ncbi:hypothetical protein ACGFYU_36315 [Streptomyces sp. NPDC048337]|uniref:hypothetical protein n=1 Tax=Streptomyces sp. NPDC048337 TaxID=3365535 RepID=UPI0037106A9A